MMECTVNWTGSLHTNSGMGFIAETGSGHLIAMDGAKNDAQPSIGGKNLAPRPMELMLAGTGGCTAYDVVLILKRGRHDITGCSVKIEADRSEADPKVFTKLHMHYTVTGNNVPEAAVQRAVEMSHTKYCSASAMMEKTAAISWSVEIIQSA
jgi:putative redox protein